MLSFVLTVLCVKESFLIKCIWQKIKIRETAIIVDKKESINRTRHQNRRAADFKNRQGTEVFIKRLGLQNEDKNHRN